MAGYHAVSGSAQEGGVDRRQLERPDCLEAAGGLV